MNKLLMALSMTCAVGGFLCSSHVLAQQTGQPLPPAPKAATVTIITQPTLEGAHDDTAIIRWTTNNPGGSNDHFGVVQYGTSPSALTKTAKSHIRLNQGHSETMFRVRIDGLQPQTTYYYTVTSMEANGTNDGVTSAVNRFTTPAPAARIMNNPQPPG